MQWVDLNHIETALTRINPHIRRTPLELSAELSEQSGCDVFLKLENWQKTGSFKIRGALNKVLSLPEEEKRKGIITASAGNHALGVAHAAGLLNVPTKIVVPTDASPAKVKALLNYDIELVKMGADYDEAEAFAWDLQKQEELTFVHAFSDPEIIAGQGTVAIEIIEDLPGVETVLVPIGGGGLISGAATALKAINPEIRVIGVESEASPAMHNSIRAGKVIETGIDETIADGLAGRFVTDLTLKYAQDLVDEVVLVSEEGIRAGVRMIAESEHMLIEGSAAVGVAALLENKIFPAKNCVILLTGRNIALGLLQAVLQDSS